MDIRQILADLGTERDCIDRAIAAIEGLDSTGRRRADRPLRAMRKHRTFSAATRARMAAAQHARWAKARPTAPKPARRRMSAAGRKKISQAAKRRWAEWRRMQKKPVAKVA